MRFVSENFLTKPTPFWEVTPEIWERLIATNVNGPFLMARAATPHFLSAGWGRIINISINRQTINRKGFSPYGLSKAAVEAETAIWAQDFDGTGITVNALLPGGATLTGMIPEGQPEHIRASLLKPEIIVPPLLWLVSDASNDATGKRIVATEWNNDDHQFESAGF
jgi:NAD(P)-dependent dehydrogenase (short-subunit alcohol dehydrogenase family)